MGFLISIFLSFNMVFAQTLYQGKWSSDEDNPPGLEKARSKNYEKNHRPPSKHPPTYQSVILYEFQADLVEEKNNHLKRAKRLRGKRFKSSKYRKKAKKVKCTYTCNKKLKPYNEGGSKTVLHKSGKENYKNWKKDQRKSYISPIYNPYKYRRPSSISRDPEGSHLR
ncbi:MAG: hypothetical protein KC493_17180 [Bacteriovoracaceae bacterium]|nr:hypothetical protein [Bacteriovoracaceae bacterium]